MDEAIKHLSDMVGLLMKQDDALKLLTEAFEELGIEASTSTLESIVSHINKWEQRYGGGLPDADKPWC